MKVYEADYETGEVIGYRNIDDFIYAQSLPPEHKIAYIVSYDVSGFVVSPFEEEFSIEGGKHFRTREKAERYKLSIMLDDYIRLLEDTMDYYPYPYSTVEEAQRELDYNYNELGDYYEKPY